jgi:hypothetical protein
MAMKSTFFAISLLLTVRTSAQAAPSSQKLPKFMGREVTVTESELGSDGYYPKGPASVCVERPPQRQCYTAPQNFGRSPKVEVIEVQKDEPALFFSAKSGGVSGFTIHFALLQPGDGKDLVDLFGSVLEVSNLSQHVFWSDSTISTAPIFVTADWVSGPDEAHYTPHRYIISSYVLKPLSLLVDGLFYYLEDRYMTVQKYDLEANEDILDREKPEVTSRLLRVKTESERK